MTPSPAARSSRPIAARRAAILPPSWWMRNAENRCISISGPSPSAAFGLVALAVLAQLIGARQPVLLAEELGDLRELLLVDAGGHAGHDRILALAALVGLQRVHD